MLCGISVEREVKIKFLFFKLTNKKMLRYLKKISLQGGNTNMTQALIHMLERIF